MSELSQCHRRATPTTTPDDSLYQPLLLHNLTRAHLRLRTPCNTIGKVTYGVIRADIGGSVEASVCHDEQSVVANVKPCAACAYLGPCCGSGTQGAHASPVRILRAWHGVYHAVQVRRKQESTSHTAASGCWTGKGGFAKRRVCKEESLQRGGFAKRSEVVQGAA